MHFAIAFLLAGVTILMPPAGTTTTSWNGKQRIRELVDQCSGSRNRDSTLAKLEEYFEQMSGGLPWLNREIVNNKVLTDAAKRRGEAISDLLVMDLDNDGSVTRLEIRTSCLETNCPDMRPNSDLMCLLRGRLLMHLWSETSSGICVPTWTKMT